MLTIVKNFGLEILAVILLCVSPAIAQDNKCNLKIRVVEFEDEIALVETDVKIRNIKTNEIFDNKGQIGEELVFLNLPTSDYEITAKKENFKQSVEKFELTCKVLDSGNYTTRWVNLQIGDSKEKVEMDHRNRQIPKFGVITGQVAGNRDVDEEVVKQKRKERLEKFAKLNNILNGEATYLAKPEFPKAAQAARASGVVYVKININESGEIELAQAVSGHPLLRQAATEAAKKAKFKSTLINGKPAKVSGFLIYNFTI